MTASRPLQNRVTPDGQILAVSARGLMMGNRGILHDAGQHLGNRRWAHPNWVACRLEFRGRHRPVMQPRRYTELFFLDEAVALAAGHRPCAECRRADYRTYQRLWQTAHGGELPRAAAMDAALHRARVRRDRGQITHDADLADLPDGCFIAEDGLPHLVLGGALHPYAPGGYGAPVPRRRARVAVLTPQPTVAVLRQGYRAMIHPSADAG